MFSNLSQGCIFNESEHAQLNRGVQETHQKVDTSSLSASTLAIECTSVEAVVDLPGDSAAAAIPCAASMSSLRSSAKWISRTPCRTLLACDGSAIKTPYREYWNTLAWSLNDLPSCRISHPQLYSVVTLPNTYQGCTGTLSGLHRHNSCLKCGQVGRTV